MLKLTHLFCRMTEVLFDEDKLVKKQDYTANDFKVYNLKSHL